MVRIGDDEVVVPDAIKWCNRHVLIPYETVGGFDNMIDLCLTTANMHRVVTGSTASGAKHYFHCQVVRILRLEHSPNVLERAAATILRMYIDAAPQGTIISHIRFEMPLDFANIVLQVIVNIQQLPGFSTSSLIERTALELAHAVPPQVCARPTLSTPCLLTAMARTNSCPDL